MTQALHLTDARIVCPAGGERNGALLIVDGTIAAGEAPSHAERVDCRGRVLAPGIIDVGVARIDRAAARAGGVVRVAPMPDQTPVLDEPGAVQRLALIGRPDVWIHPIAAATRGLQGQDLAEMAICLSAGARAVGTGRGWIADSGVMHRVLMYARDLDVTVVSHAEDGGLAAGAVATEGETATRLGLPAAPALAEPLAIARDLLLAEETGARLHLRCVTTAAGFALVRAAKARGVRVTCGITPAYLLLSDNAMSDFRTFAHLSPPLRSEDDRKAALAALSDGTIDLLCSGHDPHGPEEKRLPFADASAGAADAATLLPLALGLVRDGRITLPRLFALLAQGPAALLRLDTGTLAAGMPGDVILIDEHAPWQIDTDRLPGMAGNTPFDGLPVQGKVTAMWKGGRPVAG
ncbi:dihydroorotase [Sphingomonas phyllosphaerae]|uniref:dihydroorotase n=1 Tax=Sphingomonas phyllosphaerae TaxID=257003 RepID=UPI0003B37379|nr:dihydroorotase [Sphingomonas phyllosphaerae]